jgi:hypothetical protein
LVHTASGGRVHCLEVLVKLAVLVEGTLVGLATAACGPEAVDPLATPTWEFTLATTSTNTSEVAVRSESAELSVEEAWLSLRSFEMVPCSSDAAPISQSDHPNDLTSAPPAHLAFETGVSDYCAIRLLVTPSSEAEPAELANLSVHVRGTRSDDVPFEIRSALELDIELRAPSGARFDARHFAVGFDLAAWFTGVDVQGASETEGIALVDSSSNAAVLSVFETNTSVTVALYEDADRDGLLDDDELTPVATAD